MPTSRHFFSSSLTRLCRAQTIHEAQPEPEPEPAEETVPPNAPASYQPDSQPSHVASITAALSDYGHEPSAAMLCIQAFDANVSLKEGAAREISEQGGARGVVKALRRHAFPVEDTEELQALREAGQALLLRTTVRKPTLSGGHKCDGRWLGNADKLKVWPQRAMTADEARSVLDVYRRRVGVLRWKDGVRDARAKLEAQLKPPTPWVVREGTYQTGDVQQEVMYINRETGDVHQQPPGMPSSAMIEGKLEEYLALGPAMTAPEVVATWRERHAKRIAMEKAAAAKLREDMFPGGQPVACVVMRTRLAAAVQTGLLQEDTMAWAAGVIKQTEKKEAYQAKIEAEQLAKKQKEAEEEAERSLAAMKAKRKRVLKSQSKSVLGMLAAGARGTKERKEEEALMAEHQGALEELEKIQAEMAVSVHSHSCALPLC